MRPLKTCGAKVTSNAILRRGVDVRLSVLPASAVFHLTSMTIQSGPAFRGELGRSTTW